MASSLCCFRAKIEGASPNTPSTCHFANTRIVSGNFMTDLKKIFDIVLKVAPFAYILGFFVVNGYLTSYDFTEYNILNLTFLKTGILFIIFASLIIVAVYFSFTPETMTDNYKKSWPSIVLSLYLLHLLTFLLVPLFRDANTIFEKRPVLPIMITALKLLLVLFMLWASNKIPKNSGGVLLLTIPAIVLMIVILSVYSYYNSSIAILWAAVMVLGVKVFLVFGDIGDKNYKIGVLPDFIFLIAFAFFFGKLLYPKIPNNFGGGQPYQIALSKSQNILTDTITSKLDTFSVLYENDARFLLLSKSKEILSAEKSELKSFAIVKSSR